MTYEKTQKKDVGIFGKCQNIHILLGFFIIITLFFSVAFIPKNASASMIPTLNLGGINNGLVEITVNGEPYSSVNLYYYANNSSSYSSINLGSTNGNGYFNTSVNSNSYNINSGSSVYVVVNGMQSSTMTWPYYTGYNDNNGDISLSQNNVYLNAGENRTITIYGNNSNSFYISSNGNSNVANVTLNGNTINIYGNNSGDTNYTICSNYNGNRCVTLYISVNGNNYNNLGPITLSQNNVTVGVGQNTYVTIYGGNNVYYIPSGSGQNTYNASVTINEHAVTIYGRNTGSQNVTICSTTSRHNNSYDYNSCVNLNVNVVGYSTYNYGVNPYSYVYPTLGTNASGVFLSQIPYTGLEENIKIFLFVLGLFIWSAFLAYIFISKKTWTKVLATNLSNTPVASSSLASKFKRENFLKKRN